jgi:hypothetical protein
MNEIWTTDRFLAGWVVPALLLATPAGAVERQTLSGHVPPVATSNEKLMTTVP